MNKEKFYIHVDKKKTMKKLYKNNNKPSSEDSSEKGTFPAIL